MALDTRAKRLGMTAVPGVTPMFPGDGTLDARDRRHMNDCLGAFGASASDASLWRQDHDSAASGFRSNRAPSTVFVKAPSRSDNWVAQVEARERR